MALAAPVAGGITLPPMTHVARIAVGAWNVALGAAALVALVAAYGLAEGLVAAQEGAAEGVVATATVRWWGPDFGITLGMSVLLVGAAAGVVGSVIQQSIVFAARAGHDTLQQGYVWWYLLRPVWSALLGLVVVVAVNTGLISIGDQTTSAAGVAVLVTTGALAGLYTDRALQALRRPLGAGDPAKPAASDPPTG